MKLPIRSIWSQNKSFILFVFLMLVFRGAIADWNEVPTGSMKPTIIEGDRIWVNKVAYDLKLPLTHFSLFQFSEPERGDIVIFESDTADKRLVKRLIGLPGDHISLKNNVLSVNGHEAQYQAVANTHDQFYETIDGSTHKIKINTYQNHLSSFDSVTVPDDHYLVLGDNRDNSADSRAIGFVPRKELIGRSEHVVISLDYNNYYLPRRSRVLQDL